MKLQIFFILLISIVSCANGYPFRYFFDKFKNSGSVESQEIDIGNKLTLQLNELTYGLMSRSAIAGGNLFGAIQNDISKISTRLNNLNNEVKEQINNEVEDLKKFISTLSLALNNKGLQESFREVTKELVKILPNIEKLINTLIKADVRIDNLIPNAFNEIKNYNLVKAILADLNPFNLLSLIRNSIANFSFSNIINNLISVFIFILNVIPKILTGIFNIGGLFDIGSSGINALLYLNRLGKQFNELSFNSGSIRNSNTNLFGDVRDRFNYVNYSL